MSTCSYVPKRPLPYLLLFLFFSTILMLCSNRRDLLISPQADIHDIQELIDRAFEEKDDVKEQTTNRKLPINHEQQPATERPKTQNLPTVPPETQIVLNTPSSVKLAQKFISRDFMSGGGLTFYNSILKQRLLLKFYSNDLKNDPLCSLVKVKKVCMFLVQNSLNRIDVAAGYDCLLQLQMKETSKNLELDIFRAIKYGSLSLETFYTQVAAINLFKTIISGYEEEVAILRENTVSVTQFCTGYRKDEEEFLEEVFKLNIPGLSERVMARQSIIHMFGRSSFNENATQIDLELAIDKVNYFRNAAKIKQNNVLDVVITATKDYAIAVATCLVSTLVNSDLDSFYRFHVIMDPERLISEDSQRKLASYTHIRDYSIDFNVFPLGWISGVVKNAVRQNDKRFITMYRLYFDKLFPDLDTVLYIDTDIIVKTDLNVLKTFDMTDYIWAGAPDVVNGYMHPFCNDQLPHHFVNAGVLYINLTNSRRVAIHDKIIDYILYINDCAKHEQALINAVFSDYVYFLPHRWNAIVKPRNERLHFSSFLVHHISGGMKPWKGDNPRLLEDKFDELPWYRQEWGRYRRLTGFVNSES